MRDPSFPTSSTRSASHPIRFLTLWAMLASTSTSAAQTAHDPSVAESTAAKSPAGGAPAAGPASSAAPSEPNAEGGGTMRTAGLVVGGVGVAGLTVFTITALMAKSTFNDLKAQCPTGCADPDHLDQIDRGKSLQLTANVGLAVGLIGLGTGAALFALGLQGRRDPAVSLSLSNGGGVVSYGTTF